MFHRAFFNSIIDKHQHMHFTFNNILVLNVDFIVKIYKSTPTLLNVKCMCWCLSIID